MRNTQNDLQKIFLIGLLYMDLFTPLLKQIGMNANTTSFAFLKQDAFTYIQVLLWATREKNVSIKIQTFIIFYLIKDNMQLHGFCFNLKNKMTRKTLCST